MSKATRVLPVDPLKIGRIVLSESSDLPLDRWALHLSNDSQDAAYLREAANELRNSDIPVAFPTETVYGLGADATRSSAVKGIYAAKQRPSDNPLIVHISSLQQLRGLLLPKEKVNMRIANGDSRPTVTDGDSTAGSLNRAHHDSELADPIPAIYKPLIQKFWPGPLTLIMPKPENSVLAPEVTAGLNTFGARMPRNLLALALIKLADVPVAAPSANASTKPSPTAAEHVKHDLDGRIDIILDGGPCDVGVESTVVDGLSNPPSILRPGGISIDQLRQCPGWERTVIGYKNASEQGMQPKAPGMKYRHYSPKAKVILYESGTQRPSLHDMLERLSNADAIGIIQTRSWGRSSAAHGIGETTTPGVEEQIKENGVPPLRVQVDTERNYETRMANNPSSPSASSKERPLSHSPSSSTQRLSSSVPPRNMPKHHVTVEERLNMIRGPFGMSREELLEYRKSMGRDSPDGGVPCAWEGETAYPDVEAEEECFTDSDDDNLQESFNDSSATVGVSNMLHYLTHHQRPWAQKTTAIWTSGKEVEIWTVDLGPDIESVARGLFSALRELDLKHVQAIFVEGINEIEGDLAAAVMNRLRKAAEINIPA